MRIKHKVIVKIADDTELKDKFFETDETLAETVIDNYQRENSGKMNVAATATESVPFGDVDVPKGVFLKSDEEIEININGLGNIQLRKGGSASSCKFFWEGDVTSLTVTAGATLAANVIYAVWGDPTP